MSSKNHQQITKASHQSPTTQSLISVSVPPIITINDLAQKTGLPAALIIQTLLKNGVVATINESIDRETVEIIADELNLKIVSEDWQQETDFGEQTAKLEPRPPVVTILGHVDHGKTTLLDAIRKTNVVQGESGGITQHIGAYQVEKVVDKKNRKITFIDTPGHETFSALRAHGAQVTDIAILVVAADDGVMAQTKEALSHIKAANVPVIVAITKIDKAPKNADKIKGQLAEIQLNPEDWGGKTPVILVSAKEGTGIDELLDTIILVSDLEEFKARISGYARGAVIEAHQEVGVGAVATLLVQEGTLHQGDALVVGSVFGKVRTMQNEHGQILNQATPSMPVKVSGLRKVPQFGAKFMVVKDEKQARIQAIKNQKDSRSLKRNVRSDSEELVIPVIIKADVNGSLKALSSAVENQNLEKVKIQIIHEGVGSINESDVHMATSADGIILGFRVGLSGTARALAAQHHIKIIESSIIYELLEQFVEAVQSRVVSEEVVEETGRLKVLKIFHLTRTHQIVGGKIEAGTLQQGATITVLRNKEVVGQGKLASLKSGQKTVESLSEGNEAGLGIDIDTKIEEGDVLVSSIKVLKRTY